MKPGPHNLITDIHGLRVGNATNSSLNSGTTVITCDEPFTASVDVMGGAPGSRETDLLAPDKVVEQIDAIVLSGGSAFGLDAAGGVTDRLRELNRGFPVGPVRVPIVSAAIIFDLLNGGDKNWSVNPYRQLGIDALHAAKTNFPLGSVGAGTGATTATVKGGLGSASLKLDNGVTVGALIVANPHGSATVYDAPNFWAAPFEANGEFGALGPYPQTPPLTIPRSDKLAAFNAKGNTTIGVIATDAALTKSQLKRLAVSAQDGLARALVPSHTPFDGDMLFAVATGKVTLQDPIVDPATLGHAGAVCVSRAIARGVYEATPAANDILPTWQEKYGALVNHKRHEN